MLQMSISVRALPSPSKTLRSLCKPDIVVGVAGDRVGEGTLASPTVGVIDVRSGWVPRLGTAAEQSGEGTLASPLGGWAFAINDSCEANSACCSMCQAPVVRHYATRLRRMRRRLVSKGEGSGARPSGSGIFLATPIKCRPEARKKVRSRPYSSPTE